MNKTALSIVPLNKTHDVSGFDCGNETLNSWLRSTAGQHARKSLSRTFVLVDAQAPTAVRGFYTLSVRAMTAARDLHTSLATKLPMHVPGFTLARLAVAVRAQRQGHGERLLVDAMVRARRAAQEVGGALLFVDAKDESVAAFYRRYGFSSMASAPLILYIDIAVMH